ncbi:MAG TPA: Fe-S cluster assembly ATPase SufC [Chloroflexota bacterium]|jgi:Fe-S cluster assembly ATP-binding protein|nr:Fe-S cluster assembly ATPase SufC [Chloroflexota bacterium]
MTVLFEIENLHVSVEGREILRGVELTIQPGEVHALMGRNGSGKSTLANALMGHPKYLVTQGSVRLGGEDVLALRPEERAKKGLFLAFQNPISIPGVGTGNFLRAAVKAVRGGEAISALGFRKELAERMQNLQIDPSFATRSLNEGFSGGEKKRAEMLQLAMLKPRMAVLDEPDSGLDIDAVRIVSEGINTVHQQQPDMGVLLITHYQRILNYIRPDRVHVMANGRIVESGGEELVHQLESEGYDPILRRLGIEAEEATPHGH